jgi:hypothetical protein
VVRKQRRRRLSRKRLSLLGFLLALSTLATLQQLLKM